jgi:hypothetical protein
MKAKYFSFCLLINFFVLHYASADNFSLSIEIPTFMESAELKDYLDSISLYQPEVVELDERLNQTIDYYKKVHILKTVKKPNYIIDCIPFAEQPALIHSPKLAENLIEKAKLAVSQNYESLKEVGSYFEFNSATECPLGSVAILRPTKAMLTSKSVVKKGINQIISQQNNSVMANGGGYTWEQGVTQNNQIIQIPTQNAEAYFKGPQLQFVSSNNGSDHSIDQFWLTNSSSNRTYSVEFGLIASRYFTSIPSTSIFIFASVDNYSSNSCYNVICSNFIQSPGTPAFGVPISNKRADFIFQVNHESKISQSGFYLTLVTYDSTATNPRKISTVLGYYPNNIFPSLSLLPNAFSVGAEVYAEYAGDGSKMYGNYVNPYPSYHEQKQIGIYTQNGNYFPYYSSSEPSPYGLIWHFGQKSTIIPIFSLDNYK